MSLFKLIHAIVDELPIHDGRKADLHKQVDETLNEPEEDKGDGEVNGTSSPDGTSS